MRKMANLLLAAAALSLTSLGVASPALAAASPTSVQTASHARSDGSPADDGHHTCPRWQAPYCGPNQYPYDLDTTAPNYNLFTILGNSCKNMGFNSMDVLKNENYKGSNGRAWQRGAYRCYNR